MLKMIPFLVAAVLFTVALPQVCFSQSPRREAAMKERFLKEAGSIEGAIWTFSLTPLVKSPGRDSVIRGAYRVSDLTIYQAGKPGGEWTKEIGKIHPDLKSKTTVVECTKLRGKTGPNQWAKPLEGKALLSLVEAGKLEGEFVDSEGHKWKMRTMRIRE